MNTLGEIDCGCTCRCTQCYTCKCKDPSKSTCKIDFTCSCKHIPFGGCRCCIMYPFHTIYNEESTSITRSKDLQIVNPAKIPKCKPKGKPLVYSNEELYLYNPHKYLSMEDCGCECTCSFCINCKCMNPLKHKCIFSKTCVCKCKSKTCRCLERWKDHQKIEFYNNCNKWKLKYTNCVVFGNPLEEYSLF